jgi:hypothetical protein
MILTIILVGLPKQSVIGYLLIGWISNIYIYNVDFLNEDMQSDLGIKYDVGSHNIGYHPTNKSHI